MSVSIWEATAPAATPESVLSPFRNRIINGDMRICQRSGETPITISTAAFTYTLDRWAAYGDAGGSFSVQQRHDTPPEGHSHFLRVTVLTPDNTLDGVKVYLLKQAIEGYNIQGFDFGVATAKQIAVSFKIRGSVPGLYTFALKNNLHTQNYLFDVLLEEAGVWEDKIVYVPGETAGPWRWDHESGLELYLCLGASSNWWGSTAVWTSSDFYKSAVSNDLISNGGATLDITGVQIEAATVASEFEYRPIGQEISLCFRYYQRFTEILAPGSEPTAFLNNTSNWDVVNIRWAVQMRAAPVLANNDLAAWVAGNPAAGQTAVYNFVANGYGTITGAFSMAFVNATKAGTCLRLTAGTSFSGTNGSAGAWIPGNSTIAASAEL